MRAVVSQDTCIGCGLCPSIAPDVFEMKDDGKAHVIANPVPKDSEDAAKEAADSCPVNAIAVE
ncbi:Ferredoxin [Caloramator mitchellensis]|uniref:Ferredoxin n=1 Tax=Caloramator mitchellensis TaxID=908809 RepID=A0A0R3JZ67_CALMK|nr:ferredoxin [Caloramator mitchellensis]KRQ85826.1 Ferredoxin [Caloramator mitchellensis]